MRDGGEATIQTDSNVGSLPFQGVKFKQKYQEIRIVT